MRLTHKYTKLPITNRLNSLIVGLHFVLALREVHALESAVSTVIL